MLLKKLLFSFLFCLCFSFLVFGQEVQKIQVYKEKILEQLKQNQQDTKTTISLLKKLEKNFSVSKKQIAIDKQTIFQLEKKIKTTEQKLTKLNESLQQTLDKIHQNFLGFYLLQKIKQHSILPDFTYLLNYNRNQKVVEILLDSDIHLEKDLQTQVVQRNKQLALWKQNKQEIVVGLKKLAISEERLVFDRQQYSIFLQQLKKQQVSDKKVLSEIENSFGKIVDSDTLVLTNQSKNQVLPVYGELIETFGNQNPRIPFYHKNGILVQTKIQEKVRAIREGEIIFLDNISRYNILMVVKHNEQEFSTYGRLTNVPVKQGDLVKTNQFIGEVASYDEKKGILYFAIRKNGQAIDPMK